MTALCPSFSVSLAAPGSSDTGPDSARPASLSLPFFHLTFPLSRPRPPPFLLFPLKKTTAHGGGRSFPYF